MNRKKSNFYENMQNDNDRRNFLAGLFFWILAFLSTLTFKKGSGLIGTQKNLDTQVTDKTNLTAENAYEIAYVKHLDKTGVIDCSNAINAAVSTSNVEEFRLSDGTYAIANTIIIPKGKKLILSQGAILKVTSDINVIQLNTESQFIGGKIDCSSVPTFSHAVFYISGINMYAFKVLNTYAFHSSYKGIGVQLNAPERNYIFGGMFQDVLLKGFDIGVNYVTKGTGWVNENSFNGQIQSCSTGIQLIGADGNKFNCTGQAGIKTTRSIIDCSNSNYNYFDVFVFDVGQSGYTQTYAHFYNGSYQNVLTHSKEYEKNIIEESPGFNKIPIKHPYLLPSNGINTEATYNGMQDNFLVAADRRFTVTETLTNVVRTESTPTSHMFKTNGNSYTEYQFSRNWLDTDNAQILINLDTPTRINWLGISFTSYIAQKVTISIYDGSNWNSKTFDNNRSAFVYWNPLIDTTVGYTPTGNITQIQFKLNRPKTNGTFNSVRVASIMASSPNGGYAFLPINGGTLYGNLVMGNNYFTVGSVASLPTPSATYRGQVILVLGDGISTADIFYICLQSDTGNYSWKKLMSG